MEKRYKTIPFWNPSKNFIWGIWPSTLAVSLTYTRMDEAIGLAEGGNVDGVTRLFYVPEHLVFGVQCVGRLHCVDTEEHDVFTDNGGLGEVVQAAKALGLEVHTADAFELVRAGGQDFAADLLPPGQLWDMLWLDGITMSAGHACSMPHEGALSDDGGLAVRPGAFYADQCHRPRMACLSRCRATSHTGGHAVLCLRPADPEGGMESLVAGIFFTKTCWQTLWILVVVVVALQAF
jgi:hypothetical protein